MSHSKQNPIIIIGSGLAGYMLAKEFRKLDTKTPLQIITASDGRFYSKPQLSNALSSVKTAETLTIATAEQMAQQLNVEIKIKTKVTAIDGKQQLILANNEWLPYQKLVLALGADVIKPDLKGNAANEILHINDLEDYALFREKVTSAKKLAILGAGLVGCEFANDLASAGHYVEVVAPSQYPLDSLLPESVGAVIHDALAEKNITWHLQQMPLQLDRLDDGYLLNLSSRQLQVDLVLSAIGLRPHIDLAKQAGISSNRGIVVDRKLQASAKNVYALGDCAEVNGLVMLFVAPLLNCARALAKTLTGQITEVVYPAMPIVIKTPACPIAVLPPPRGFAGEWRVEGSGRDLKALFYDSDGVLKGFALTGRMTVEKQKLAQQLPPVFK